MNQRINRMNGIGMTSRRTRERMIERLKQQGITDSRVLAAMRKTPRHIFVDEALASRSYEDIALPIGYNQTISQPYIVAKMTELLLAKQQPSKVLEIGTGCGYQTALLAQLVDRVYSVERIGGLLKKAKSDLRDLECTNVKFQHSDGECGWAEQAPFDGIIVTAAPADIPTLLLRQMAIGGVMLIPVGTDKQELHQIIRTKTGYQDEVVEAVSFVPFLAGRQ